MKARCGGRRAQNGFWAHLLLETAHHICFMVEQALHFTCREETRNGHAQDQDLTKTTALINSDKPCTIKAGSTTEIPSQPAHTFFKFPFLEAFSPLYS